MKLKEKRPSDWTSEEGLTALMTTGSMSSEECASWCRKKGIFPHHLEQWKQDAISDMSNTADKQHPEKEYQYKKRFHL